jgi:hypothetical protein
MEDKGIIHGGAPSSVERPADSNVDDRLSENENMVKLRERQRSQSGLADHVDGGSGDDNDASQPHNCLDMQCCQKWPRTCSLLFGVVLPLWALIFISLIFGSILSQVEAPEEGRFYSFGCIERIAC